MSVDWYRKTTWEPADCEDFEARLKRSREVFHKSQYLRIQAVTLQRATPPLYREALSLIERVLTEWRDDSQVADALLQKAECLLETEGFEAAIPAFREGLKFEKQHPQYRTDAWIIFPWQIVKHRRTDLFGEALKWLAFRCGPTLPVDKFRASSIRAIVAMEQGDAASAKSHASNALKAAGIDFSGFRHHPKIGLVGDIAPWVKTELERILAA
jgi:tetratricopeptide (TPR) repeat protein